MPFGAHETMEVHEILAEKINMISHFNLYATQVKNPQLKEIIKRHQQEEVNSYDVIVAYTHDYQPFMPLPSSANINVQPEQIQYGLNNPSMIAPETNAVFNDYEVALAMLHCHKNGAANGMKASLEIADPNLRQMLMNGAVNCANQAYEVFLFMNQQGYYQIPQLKDHTAKTLLHSYQPVSESVKAQYVVQPGQTQAYDPSMAFFQQTNPSAFSMNAGQGMAGNMPMGQQGQKIKANGMAQGMMGYHPNMNAQGQMPMGNINPAAFQGNMQQNTNNQHQMGH
ncbi:spore coat protein [Neobacillus sp. Marseille-QA0830]